MDDGDCLSTATRFGAVLKDGRTLYFDACFVVLGYYRMGTGLGLSLEEFLGLALASMQRIAADLGL